MFHLCFTWEKEPTFTEIRPTCQIQMSFFCKVLPKHRHVHSFTLSFTATFMKQRQSWVVVTERRRRCGPQSPKYLPSGPLQKGVPTPDLLNPNALWGHTACRPWACPSSHSRHLFVVPSARSLNTGPWSCPWTWWAALWWTAPCGSASLGIPHPRVFLLSSNCSSQQDFNCLDPVA